MSVSSHVALMAATWAFALLNVRDAQSISFLSRPECCTCSTFIFAAASPLASLAVCAFSERPGAKRAFPYRVV
eukprot:IDg4083t1